jgi:hypothetical protein
MDEPEPSDQPDSPPGASPAPAGNGADLLTIGLLVFFVSLLVVVAALLVLPAIVG